EHQEIPLRIKLTTGRLRDAFLNHLPGLEIYGSCRCKIADLRQISAFDGLNTLNGFRNDEVQVGIPLPMRVCPQVDGHAVREECDIRSMIGIESAKKVLIRLSRSAGMLDRHHTGDQAKDLGRPAMRLQDDFSVWNE